MAYQHRPLRADDLEQAWKLDQQVFNGDGRHRAHFDEASEPERFQGVFDEHGRLVAMSRALSLGQYFGGKRVSMGGLSSVGVAPEARGRGLGVATVRACLADMRARHEVVSTLHPGTTGLYRKLGWELAGAYAIRHVSCAALRNLSVPVERRIVRAEPSDRARVRACYERVAPTINGFLDRNESRWYYLEKAFDEFFIYLALDAAGEVAGYIAYRHEAPLAGELGYTIRVHDWMAETREALAALFWTVGSGSTQAAIVAYESSPEDPLLMLVDDQVERVHYDVRVMTRMVDAAGAVAERGYARALDVDLPLVIEECGASEQAAMLADNAGAWRLQVAKGEGRLERTAQEAPEAPRISVAGLASLYTGWAPTAFLERAGLLSGGSPEVREALDAAFAGPTPWVSEEF